MIRFQKNKRGLGAPVGNLIILLAAVILSTTVVLYATTVTANQVQKESLYISETTMDTTQATIKIKNTGPTSIMVNQVVIKGEKVDYTSDPDISATGLAKGAETTLTIMFTDDLITIDDIGRPVTIIISTSQATYFTQTLVQATLSAAPGP